MFKPFKTTFTKHSRIVRYKNIFLKQFWLLIIIFSIFLPSFEFWILSKNPGLGADALLTLLTLLAPMHTASVLSYVHPCLPPCACSHHNMVSNRNKATLSAMLWNEKRDRLKNTSHYIVLLQNILSSLSWEGHTIMITFYKLMHYRVLLNNLNFGS